MLYFWSLTSQFSLKAKVVPWNRQMVLQKHWLPWSKTWKWLHLEGRGSVWLRCLSDLLVNQWDSHHRISLQAILGRGKFRSSWWVLLNKLCNHSFRPIQGLRTTQWALGEKDRLFVIGRWRKCHRVSQWQSWAWWPDWEVRKTSKTKYP